MEAGREKTSFLTRNSQSYLATLHKCQLGILAESLANVNFTSVFEGLHSFFDSGGK